MANQFINSMSDLWNSAGTAYSSIKMNVTNAASAGDTTDPTKMSKLIHMQIGSVDKFRVDKLGNLWTAGSITGAGVVSSGASLPTANDGAALGASGTAWSDLFLASGGVVNWNQNDVTITHVPDKLLFAGATLGFLFDNPITPTTNDLTSIGLLGTAWSDLFLASGAIIDFASSDVTITHTTDTLTVGGGDFRVPLAGANAASVVTVGGTQTLTNKTLASPTITGTTTASTLTVSGNITTSSGTVTANQNFASSTATTVLATTGAGSVLLRPNGAASTTGQVTVSSAGAITTAGDINCNDLHSVRTASPTTGVLYLGNSNARYLFYDGTSYVLAGAGLAVGGAISTNALTISSTAPQINFGDTDQGQTRYIHHNGGLIGFLGSGGGWILRTDDGGALWSAQFGDFNTYWEGRCGAHQDAAVSRVPGTIAAMGASAYGSYFFGRSTVANLGTGANLAGSQLHWSNAAGDAPGTIGPGSWRGMGWVGSGVAESLTTLFLRYA